MSLVVGIDLGTTNSCVAWYGDGEVHIIENEEEQSTISSFVFYDDDEITVGQEAEHRSTLNPNNGIFDSKRMLGCKFDDKEIQSNLLNWPFTVTKADNGEPQIEIQQKGQVLTVRPEEVSAEILRKLRKLVSTALERNITDAVITVPAYFSNSQRQATKDAAKIAGLNVLKLINEPTAAAFAFIEQNEESKDRTVLVYDLGAGTFDVSLIKFRSNTKEGEVLSISGDSHLGGRDFDNNLLSFFIDEVEMAYNINIRGDDSKYKKIHSRRVRSYCEKIKIALSESKKATFFLEEFLGHDVRIQITREQFEKLNETLINRTIEIVDKVLTNAKITKEKVDDVVLVGGSTRIPKIQQLIRDYFGGKNLNKSVNPDEAVARGAAIQAALLSNDQKIDGHSLTDVTPFSLGIEVMGKGVSVIIKKNTKIPALLEKTYYTSYDNQTVVKIRVYEGDSRDIVDNIFLGEFSISDITPKPERQVKIDVRFGVDSNGILTVKATESSKNITKDLNIVLANDRLTDKQIDKMKAQFENSEKNRKWIL